MTQHLVSGTELMTHTRLQNLKQGLGTRPESGYRESDPEVELKNQETDSKTRVMSLQANSK